jgi:hypothetical protein
MLTLSQNSMMTLGGRVGVGAINVEASIGLYVGCSVEYGGQSVQTPEGEAMV